MPRRLSALTLIRPRRYVTEVLVVSQRLALADPDSDGEALQRQIADRGEHDEVLSGESASH